ncbi:Alpha/Beta hydrolase protein [Neohortaea acidophila]|uniref:Alpha/Beta hydrolase protein n=1 Tax=Neohortaea acidophila TaxID=245834 RepID=A0A6A6PQV2_9PEZI|nr:Alpha/Beta hydrolase protein [Neohortaea acidophila]KAF2482176.1 Alpha/Beta hydrolase protein [Neohortaea acidophila]
MSSSENVTKAWDVLGEALSMDPLDFEDHESWKFLGLGDLLAAATASDLKNLGLDVKTEDFTKYPTVGEFKTFLLRGDNTAPSNGAPAASPAQLNEPADPWEGIPKPKVPLSIALQGQASKAKVIVFLLPDGSGAGGSYGSLPRVSPDVCLIGLNSPFLRQAEAFTCTIERMARLWLDEIRKLQPKGPYVLGGWSAGGYYAFEVAKLLIAAGEKIGRMILIDSPCRLQFEALPEAVVGELTSKGLMGASGLKKAPEWLVQHFTSTVISVESYMPTPIAASDVPPVVNFIWVREGLVKDVAESGLNVDLTVKVTRFLLEPRGELKTVGWERLLPGARYEFDYMTGNHFQITQPPHVSASISACTYIG